MTSLRLLYFTFFAGFGSFAPYLNLYFKRIGMTGTQIGLLASMQPLAAVLAPPLAVALLKRLGLGARGLVFLIGFSLIPMVLLPTVDLWPLMVVVLFSFMVFWVPSLPILDDATMRLTEASRFEYGDIRVWGSIGFMVASYVVGRISETAGLQSLFSAYALSAIISIFIVGAVFRHSGTTRLARPSQSFLRGAINGWGLIKHPSPIRWVFLASFILQLAGLTYYQFFSIFADTIGMSQAMIGLAWSIAVFSEVIVMALSGRITRRIGPKWLYILGMSGAALRWIAYALTTSPLLLLALQTLHGLTFSAVQVGAVTLVHRLLPDDKRSEGQSMLTVSRGLAGLTGAYLVGYLYDTTGIRFLFTASSGLALLAMGIAIRFVRLPDHRADF